MTQPGLAKARGFNARTAEIPLGALKRHSRDMPGYDRHSTKTETAFHISGDTGGKTPPDGAWYRAFKHL